MSTEKAQRNWLRIIELSGPEGRTWVEDYKRSRIDETIRSTQEALALLRAGKLDEGGVILDRVAAVCQAEDKGDVPSSMLYLLRRHYHSVAAYQHYCRGACSAAWTSLDRAEQALRALVGHPFLIALAESCIDFTIQKARIARTLRDWPLMWRCLRQARGMAANQLPLCTSDTGRAVFCSTLREELSSCGLDAEEARAWREVVDDEARRSLVERLIREVYTLPGFVIDY